MEIRDIYKLDTRFRHKKSKDEKEFDTKYKKGKDKQASFKMWNWGIDCINEDEEKRNRFYLEGE